MKTIGWMSLIFAAAAAGTLVAGCAPSGGSTSGQPSAPGAKGDFKKPTSLKITMIAKSANNPVFPTARLGAEKAAEELSKSTGVPITIDWRTPDTEDAQLQAQRVAQAVNDGANCILISCSDAAKVNLAINDAVAKGVPVMTFDSDAPDSKRFCFYGVDDVKTGAQVMDELAKLTGGKGNVAILAGNQNAPNLQKRVQGAKDAAKKYPGMKIVDTFYHVETPQDAARAVMQAMKANPQIDSWCMIGGWALFTRSLLDLDPNKIKIVAVDCLPAQLDYIDKGVAPVLFAQPTYQWGYVSVGKIVDKLVLNKDVPTINPMELVRVSKDNLNTWAKQLKDWGYPDVPAKYLK